MPDPERIWIIGASEGIGEALAQAWAERGAKLVLSARSECKLRALCTSLGPDHLAVPLDVSRHAEVLKAAKQLAATGPFDRIIHMAASYDPGKIVELDPDTAAQIVSVNLTGSFHIAQIAPPLLRQGGQLAFCGSVAGYIGLPQGQIYSATKAGVINLAESLRAELAGRVDVRLISPGFVDTRLTRRNAFSMPGLIRPEQAAQNIIRGLQTSRFEVHFPYRLTLAMKLLRVLPYWLSMPLTRRLVQ